MGRQVAESTFYSTYEVLSSANGRARYFARNASFNYRAELGTSISFWSHFVTHVSCTACKKIQDFFFALWLMARETISAGGLNNAINLWSNGLKTISLVKARGGCQNSNSGARRSS